MPPRAYWKGYLRFVAGSCPIQLLPAISEREKIRFHQSNIKTLSSRRHRCLRDSDERHFAQTI
jgi:non-homologous end joining protein Ku